MLCTRLANMAVATSRGMAPRNHFRSRNLGAEINNIGTSRHTIFTAIELECACVRCAESEVSNGWAAAQGWGPALNQNFIAANQTSTTSWSLIWSVPEALSPYQNRGAMMASTPWCGAL
jgi:hypothetical protein